MLDVSIKCNYLRGKVCCKVWVLTGDNEDIKRYTRTEAILM